MEDPAAKLEGAPGLSSRTLPLTTLATPTVWAEEVRAAPVDCRSNRGLQSCTLQTTCQSCGIECKLWHPRFGSADVLLRRVFEDTWVRAKRLIISVAWIS